MQKWKMWKIFLCSIILHTGHTRELPARCFTPTLENGWVEAQESVAGDTFVGTFRCQPGFVLSGATTVKCRQGRWSVRPENFPLCAAIGSCDPSELPSIRNGWKKANPRYSNSVYRYSCKKGYRLLGRSTVFCTQSGWSIAGQAPVCTRAGCDLGQVLGEGIQHGRARTLWGGAALRFACNVGSVLEGSSLVFCDGKSWNGTKPECLVPPSPPTLSLLVGGVQEENPLVGAGEEVSLRCETTGGNPAPALALYVGDELVSSSGQYSLTVQPVHDRVQVYCTALNTMVHIPVQSTVQVLRLKYPASSTYIRGPELVRSEDYTQYSCSSDEADPAPAMEVVATDENGEIIDINVEKMPIMKGRKGFAARVTFGIHFEKHIKIAEIECKAVNEVGEATSKLTTRVQYAPKSVDISGVTSVKHDEEKVVYTCASSASYPEANITWNKLVNGNLVKIAEEDTEVETKKTKSGVLKSSKYTLHPTTTPDESFLLFCIVKIPQLKFEKSSEVLDILITYPPEKLFITGPESVIVGEEAEYKCTVEGGNPAPTPILVVTDQYQNPVPMIPISNTSVSVMVKKDHQALHASCSAGNEAGFLQSTKDITVNYPPTAVSVSGPEEVMAGADARYECTAGLSSPPAVLEWSVVSASGEQVEMMTEEAAPDEKGVKAWLVVTGRAALRQVTVQCTASNTAGSESHSVSTRVTYPASHLTLTGPPTISSSEPGIYYCSTDDSVPAATITWSLARCSGEDREDMEDIEVTEEGVETYVTALTEGGVQTHSVMTIPDYLAKPGTRLLVSCSAREDPQLLSDTMEVTAQDTTENYGDASDDVNTIMDRNIEEEGSGIENSPSEEGMESFNTEYEIVENDNKNDDGMVKLEAVEYDTNHNNDYYIGYQGKPYTSDIPDTEADYDEDDDSDEDAADEPTYQRTEVETVNVALKLGDSPRQHVDLTPYSSGDTLGLRMWLILIPVSLVLTH